MERQLPAVAQHSHLSLLAAAPLPALEALAEA